MHMIMTTHPVPTYAKIPVAHSHRLFCTNNWFTLVRIVNLHNTHTPGIVIFALALALQILLQLAAAKVAATMVKPHKDEVIAKSLILAELHSRCSTTNPHRCSCLPSCIM